MEELFLLIAIGAGLDYGLRRSWHDVSWERSLTKGTAMLALLFWAVLLDAPSAVIIALGFSAVGDYAGSRGAVNWLLISALAFFAAHMIYVMEYTEYLNRSFKEAGPAILLAAVTTVALIVTCYNAFKEQWLASVIHGAVMLLQFSLGQMIGGEEMILAYSTSLFLISGLLLGLELFLLDEESPMRRIASPLIWLTYLAAQILTVIGLTEFMS